MPVLVLAAESDMIYPLAHIEETSRSFGTPEEHKRFRAFPGGHAAIPRSDVIREVADFLDAYLPLSR